MELINRLNSFEVVDFKSCVQIAKEFKIKFKFENNDFNKILFYTEKMIKTPNSVNIYANGLIVEKYLEGWAISCLPIPNFLDRSLMKQKEYYIHPLTESTIINVYFSEGEWKCATRKSFDIREQYWRGVKYSEILEGILDLIDKEDTEATYVFAISNKKIHLFSNKDEMRLVAKNKNFGFEYMDRVLEEDTEENNIVEKCKTALDDFITKGLVNLGFIIRSDDNECFIFKSSLMAEIEKYAYRAPFIRKDVKNRNQIIKQIENINYVVVNCFQKNRFLTSRLFGCMADDFEILNKARKFAVVNISKILKKIRVEGVLQNALYKFYLRNSNVLNTIGNRNIQNKMIENFIDDTRDYEFYYFVLENKENENVKKALVGF